MKTQRVLNRLSNCANVHYRKNQMFLSFTINSKSKMKKTEQTILEISTKKNYLRNFTSFYGGLFQFEILEILTIIFFLKTIILTSIFFEHCRVLSLKVKQNRFKKDASQLKTA